MKNNWIFLILFQNIISAYSLSKNPNEQIRTSFNFLLEQKISQNKFYIKGLLVKLNTNNEKNINQEQFKMILNDWRRSFLIQTIRDREMNRLKLEEEKRKKIYAKYLASQINSSIKNDFLTLRFKKN